eukprot:TRINITY_DN67963_c12_g5_i1.p1 TRINITY_DN67963_c12_g5~~TRINITY_DN67963_c12_g5_i1.p1  ORF type:complete len:449 (-),score=52.18 TRINITY_DN67963_c12_g5_i1:1098-2420(-)
MPDDGKEEKKKEEKKQGKFGKIMNNVLHPGKKKKEKREKEKEKEREREKAKEEEEKSTRVFGGLSKGDHQDLLNRYDIKEVLGRGAFSEVRACVHKETGTAYALKTIPKANVDLKLSHLQTEISVLQKVKHPGIVNLVELYECDSAVYMLLDLMVGGELFDHICQFHPLGYSEKTSGQIILRVLDTVEYLHANNIIHRDLKPENLLYADPTKPMDIRVTDFGLAKMLSLPLLAKTACGSPCYVAPEVLRSSQQGYTAAADMWSVGVILYVLLCGFCPFYDDKLPALYRLICSGKFGFPSPYWDPISEGPKDLIRKLLVVKPGDRLTATQAKEHFWLAGTMNDKPIPGINTQWKEMSNRRDNKYREPEGMEHRNPVEFVQQHVQDITSQEQGQVSTTTTTSELVEDTSASSLGSSQPTRQPAPYQPPGVGKTPAPYTPSMN